MQLEPIEKLTKDIIKGGAGTLSSTGARFLVDAYYQMQENRKRSDNQVRSMIDSGEPDEILQWFAKQNADLENQVKRALDAYSAASPVGQWARSQKGIGPVITAGLLAHIDIKQAPTVGHIWSFAGLDPTVQWKGRTKVDAFVKKLDKSIDLDVFLTEVSGFVNRKPENIKRIAERLAKEKKLSKAHIASAASQPPHNSGLKTLCWKVGQSFCKVSGDENAFYGQIYKKRKEYEVAKNEAGDYKDQAEKKLRDFNIGKNTDAYKAYSKGMLPPAHIQARSERYAVKIFLSHLHEVWYFHEFKKLPPNPFAIGILGHAHKIDPPGFDMIAGLVDARAA